MKKLTFISAFILMVSQVIAQTNGLTVILNKGSNSHISGQDQNNLNLGMTLTQDDKITVAPGGYVALLDKQSGQTVELIDEGVYVIADVQRKLDNQSNSVLSKYGKYLASRLLPDEDNTQNLNVTGAVERGEEGFINVFLPKVTEVYGDQFLIAWQGVDDLQNYVLTIRNHRDEVISKVRVKGNKYILSFREAPYRDMTLLSFSVQGEGESVFLSKDYGIKRIAETDRQAIESEFRSLTKVAGNQSVLDKLLIASFFEEQELLADALAYYDQALAMAPDASGFHQLYYNFLNRNNLK